jgi:hypothetical protein
MDDEDATDNMTRNLDAYDHKLLAVAEYAECEPEELDESDYDHYGLVVYNLGSKEYAVGTDEEATKAAKEYVKDTLWAFKASFLAEETELEEVVFNVLHTLFESANPAVTGIVKATCGLDKFIDAAIAADGRGHYLACYDGNESEIEYEGVVYYIYRTN